MEISGFGENMGHEREISGDRQFDFNYEVKRVNAADPRPACVRFLCLFLETETGQPAGFQETGAKSSAEFPKAGF